MSIEDIEEVSEKSEKLIELLADNQEELKELNPLLAHTQIVQLIYYLVPILKDLTQEIQNIYKQLAQKEDVITLSEIKEARNINGS